MRRAKIMTDDGPTACGDVSLFVFVMTIRGEDVYMHFLFKDSVNQSVLFCNLTRPSVIRLPFKRLRMSRASLGVNGNFIEQLDGFLKAGRLTTFQLCQPLFCHRRISDFVHGQSELSQVFIWSMSVKLFPSPRSICRSASPTLAKNSSRVISVGSAAGFASRLTYLTNRLVKVSLWAITPKLCINCAS